MRPRLYGACTAAFMASALAAAAEKVPPRVTCTPSECTASRLPAVLDDAEVLGYVKSGLTTTLQATLHTRDGAGRKQRGHAHVVMRFEPWEEFFDVEIRDRAVARTRVASPAALEKWWRELVLRFPIAAPTRGPAGLDVEVIPFSEEDEADARRWYAESLKAARPRDNRRSGNGDRGLPIEPFGQMLDALTLSSIKRSGVLRFSWSAPIEAAAAGTENGP